MYIMCIQFHILVMKGGNLLRPVQAYLTLLAAFIILQQR